MGKKHSAKTGGAAAIVKKQQQQKLAKKAPLPVESDDESQESGNNMTFNKKQKDSDDEEEDRDVFNLSLDKDEDEDDSEVNSEEESEGDSEDDSEGSDGSDSENTDSAEDDGEENETERDLKDLLNNLPANLRQQVLKKEAAAKRRKAGEQVEESDDEDSEGEDDEEEDEGWGRKKKTYWEGDTADLEIGQEMEDALEEEEAAQELHREKTKRMKASDFMEEFEGSDSGSSGSDSEASEDSAEQWGAKKGLSSKGNAAVVGNLAQVSLGQDEIESDSEARVKVEKLSKNISHLSKKQRLDIISKSSPELLGIVDELKDQVAELKGRILPIKELTQKIAKTHSVQDDVVDYLEVKAQLLLSYCTNVVFYLYMKASGRSVANHPVMKQLLKLRYVMEKMRPLDGKLKHQIDRLVQLAEMSPQDLSKHQSSDLLRPNPSALLGTASNDAAKKGSNSKKKAARHSSDEEDEEDSDMDVDDEEASEDGYGEEKDDNAGVYKVPKRTAVPYRESETALERKEQKIEKQRAKIKRSELMDTLREEFGSAPEAAASSGLGMKSGDLRKLQEEADERRDFEEDRFVRLTMSRKDKQSNKRRTAEASRLDNFDDIGDVGDFEEIAKLSAMSGGREEAIARATSSSKQSATTSSALQRAVMALAGGNSKEDAEGKRKANLRAMAASMADDSDDGDDPFAAMLAAGPGGEDGGRKRRRAPTSGMDDFGAGGGDDDSDDGNNLMEDFAQKKKKFLAEKKAHYTAEPQYAGYQEKVEEGAKRAASYEIIKNKGLTPHRKKANRNPRVKKREMFEKAVIRRKGQVRDVVSGAAGSYGGELTGIKANLARSRKIGAQ